MSQYDMICPLCHHLNRQLDLEETDGWMECENCKQLIGFPKYMPVKRVPCFNLWELSSLASKSEIPAI